LFNGLEILLILSLAIVVDLTLGEPPRVIHPVVWMGKVVSFLMKGGGGRSPTKQFLYGLGVVLVTAGIFVVSAYFILFYLKSLNVAAYVIVGAVLLKSTFSLRELRRAALTVKKFLQEDKLAEARFELRSLVGRNTGKLDKSLMVSATVESVAENNCDSFVAPLFYFLLFGVPGAVAYRVVNTLDTMIGYHGDYEYLGKFAARLDDVLNFIPARITALLLVLAAFIVRRNGRKSWQVARREHARTESPNAGWPMAAAAGALDVQLEKTGSYQLGQANIPLVPQTIGDSMKLVQVATAIWLLVCLVAGGIGFVIRA